jgi:hypothetical protein
MGNWKPPQNIRATAQAVILHNNRVLVYEGHDRQKNEDFYRPIGGTVEFLELAKDTVIREFKDKSLYAQKEFPLIEGDSSLGNAVWKEISFLIQPEVRFYPAGMKEIIAKL